MAFKAISVLSKADRSNLKTALRDSDEEGDEIRVERFSELQISSTAEEGYSGLANNDYHIALLPRQDCERSTGKLRPVSRVFLVPLTWQELLARMRGELKSSQSSRLETISGFGDVRVNFSAMKVTRCDRPVALTAQQFKLLKYLMQSPDRVFSRDELLQEVWGYNHYPSTRTVDNHICSLRQKLELNAARPIHFLTVRRMGYKFIS